MYNETQNVQPRACHVTVGHRATLTPPRRGAVQLKPLAWTLRARARFLYALRSCHLDTPFASRNTQYCATHPLTTLDPMVHWERDVRSLLRPSEHLLLILEGAFLRHGLKGDSEASSPTFVGDASLGSSSEEPRVILAIVVHVDHAIGESGSVFLYTEVDSASEAFHGYPLVLQHTFAIHAEFSLDISQLASPPPAHVPDESPETMPPPSPADTRFCVQLTEGKTMYTMVTDDLERLSSVASTCRRLRDLALKNSNHVEFHRWLKPYALHPSSWLSVKPPRDLRLACQPGHSGLSLGYAGHAVNDTSDYFVIREDWLWARSLSLATVQNVSEKKQLRIRVGTFNVNGKSPAQDLSTWLGNKPPSSRVNNNEQKHFIPPLREPSPISLSGKETGEASPLHGYYVVAHASVFAGTEGQEGQASTPEADMLVMGFQEIDHSTEAFFNFAGRAREEAWTAAILAALGDKAKRYEKLVSKQLVGILLIVFVKKDLRNCFTGIMESSLATGFMVSGNKGAVAVRISYQPNPTSFSQSPLPITFTFVNSHLAAFDDNLGHRNADFHDISRRLEFGPCIEYMWAPRTRHGEAEPQTVNIYASNVLIWLVNLNYRLNLPDEDVRHLLCSIPTTQGIHALLQFDELKSSIRGSKAFTGFDEHPISFLPTYRFTTNTLTDATGHDIKRKPAWTDRVLHKFSPFVPVSQRSYDAHPWITMSDHRPVSAEFLVDIPCMDSKTLDLAANGLYESIATFYPESPSGFPLLKLDKSTLNFEKVSYSTPVSQSLTVRNVGKVPAAFRFLPRDHSSPIHPRWLKIEPMAGFLLPGEEKTLQLTILVSHAIAAPLNLRIEKLSTLLIIHTLFGQDLFLSLDGEYEPTCLGTPLSVLTRLPGPIRELGGTENLLPETHTGNGSSREFMKLMGWLTAHDVEAIHDLFIAPGNEELAVQIHESLDTGTKLPPCPAPMAPESSQTQTVDSDEANYARTIAAVLLAFLRSLPESVVPLSLHERCAESATRDEALEMLSAFPPASVNVWIPLTAFLHLLALRDRYQAEAPTSIFAQVLLRDDIDAASPVSLLGKRRFLLFFI
ncbi:DNase I-like protein, partial [Russula emetica]